MVAHQMREGQIRSRNTLTTGSSPLFKEQKTSVQLSCRHLKTCFVHWKASLAIPTRSRNLLFIIYFGLGFMLAHVTRTVVHANNRDLSTIPTKAKRMEKSIASQRSNIIIEKSTRGLYHILRLDFQTSCVFAFVFQTWFSNIQDGCRFQAGFSVKAFAK